MTIETTITCDRCKQIIKSWYGCLKTGSVRTDRIFCETCYIKLLEEVDKF